jgi:hypothetical protein
MHLKVGRYVAEWRSRVWWWGFMRFVEIDDGSGCWNWTGQRSERGYGVYQGELAYRRVWSAMGRDRPHYMQIHHKCFNVRCVNPEHLELLTLIEHSRAHGARK